jgi:hypothetical protein
MSGGSESPFEDRLPFKETEPDDIRHVGITPSAAEQLGTVTGDAAERAALEGRPAEYRLIFQSMPVPGLPDEVRVGAVRIFQTDGPVWSQRTHIVQRPGWRPVYQKWMEHSPVGAGYRLTVCLLPVTLSEDMSARLIDWRSEALGALSLVVALFDERIAQLELAEDVVAEGGKPGETANVFDTRVRLREFTPTNRVLSTDRAALDQLAGIDTTQEDPVWAAGRWYLRAAQSGPTPDAIVFLWTALEALSKPPWGTKLSNAQRRLTDVEWAEQALRRAGFDVSQLEPSIGRLAGLRAEIVHGAVESPSLLRGGFYALEAVVRLLLRSRLGIADAGWSIQPGVPNLRGPLRRLAILSHSFRKIVWRKSAE